MVVVADLVAKIRAEGVEETRRGYASIGKAAEESAAQVERAFQIMAQSATKTGGGSPEGWLKVFQQSGAQPTGAAMSQARSEMEKTAAAAAQAVAPSQAVAKASREHADSAATGARAAHNVAEGWKMSESSLVRFGAGLAGIGLGFSLVAGAAKLVHDAVVGIGTGVLDWERSLKTLSGLYGEVGAHAAAVATAQSNLPGVLGTQQEFAQAGINASALRFRYGLSQDTIDQLTTTGGRIAFATGMTDPAQRAQLQEQILAAVQSGQDLPARYRIYTDPESVARRLGFQGAQSLQAYTPQDLMRARAAIVTQGGTQFVDQAQANQRTALDAATARAKAAEAAADNLTNYLENFGGAVVAPVAGILAAEDTSPYSAQTRERRRVLGLPDIEGPTSSGGPLASANIGGLGAIDAERNVMQATERYVRALGDSTKAQEDARKMLDELGHSVDAAGAKVLSFFGSLEDRLSIAHGDILAQGQGAITARARSAIPAFGMSGVEIGAIARGTTSAMIWQNYTAELAQSEGTDPIRRNLERLASQGTDAQRAAARRALASAPQIDIVNSRLGQANTTAEALDRQTAETQAGLERISLSQRERYVQLLRETVDLRRLDNTQQQAGVTAQMAVTRAQQAALPSQYALADAQYMTGRASALALQRMGRLLQGRSVADLPSIDDIFRMNQQGQFAAAEAGPAALAGGRAVDMASRTATAAGLAQQLTAGQLQLASLANDLTNLGDLPSQTALELKLVEHARDSLDVNKEQRDLLKDLVNIVSGRAPSATSGQAVDDIANRIAQQLFGDDASSGNLAPPDLPGNRRGPS